VIVRTLQDGPVQLVHREKTLKRRELQAATKAGLQVTKN
jgi:hypothetical protein